MMRITLGALASVLFSTILALPVAARSNEATIEGHVFADGKPMANYTMSLKKRCRCRECVSGCSCCPDQITVSTDENGFFKAIVPSGAYSAIVHGEARGQVTAPAGKTTQWKVDISK